MKMLTLIRNLFLVSVAVSPAFAYNCDQTCGTQALVYDPIFNTEQVNPFKQAACETWKKRNCHDLAGNLDPNKACGQLGGQSYIAAASTMISRAEGKFNRGLTPIEKQLIRPFLGDVVDDATLHFGVLTLRQMGRGPARIRLANDAQAFGYNIYFPRTESFHLKRENFAEHIKFIAHELVHTKQFIEHGASLREFGKKYFESYCRAGFSYSNNPYEKEAHRIEEIVFDHAKTYMNSLGYRDNPLDDRFFISLYRKSDGKFLVKRGPSSNAKKILTDAKKAFNYKYDFINTGRYRSNQYTWTEVVCADNKAYWNSDIGDKSFTSVASVRKNANWKRCIYNIRNGRLRRMPGQVQYYNSLMKNTGRWALFHGKYDRRTELDQKSLDAMGGNFTERKYGYFMSNRPTKTTASCSIESTTRNGLQITDEIVFVTTGLGNQSLSEAFEAASLSAYKECLFETVDIGFSKID